MKQTCVYLAGPMTGIDNYNFDEFNRVAGLLRQKGYRVINPAENFNGNQSLPRATYLRKAVELVAGADVRYPEPEALVLLNGWENSQGALLEVAVAQAFGLSFYLFVNNHPGYWALDPFEPNLEFRISPGAEFLNSPVAEPPRLVSAEEALGVKKVFDFTGDVDGGGYKGSMDDPGKLPMWLVPGALMRAAARSLGYGAQKYAPNNWRRGMLWSEPYSALQRHLTAWIEGEDNDPDSGLNHLDHAVACLAFLTEYVEKGMTYDQFDNRINRREDAA